MKKQVMGKVKITYKKDCIDGKLCEPVAYFEKLEQCKICKKVIMRILTIKRLYIAMLCYAIVVISYQLIFK